MKFDFINKHVEIINKITFEIALFLIQIYFLNKGKTIIRIHNITIKVYETIWGKFLSFNILESNFSFKNPKPN